MKKNTFHKELKRRLFVFKYTLKKITDHFVIDHRSLNYYAAKREIVATLCTLGFK